MNVKTCLLTFCFIAVAACSGDKGGSTSAEPVTAAECRAIVEKGAELQGLPLAPGSELMEASVQSCVNSGKVTKQDYQCVIAATSADESRACNLNF